MTVHFRDLLLQPRLITMSVLLGGTKSLATLCLPRLPSFIALWESLELVDTWAGADPGLTVGGAGPVS